MVRAVIMPQPLQPLELREYPDPVLEPGEVVLETLCSEVCGTDVHLYHGRLAGVPYPIIPGHVSVGRILRHLKQRPGQSLVAYGRPPPELLKVAESPREY